MRITQLQDLVDEGDQQVELREVQRQILLAVAGGVLEVVPSYWPARAWHQREMNFGTQGCAGTSTIE
jgi:hypothetical protein